MSGNGESDASSRGNKMDAQIDLWLLRIDYTGDNIGQNFDINIRGGLPKLMEVVSE